MASIAIVATPVTLCALEETSCAFCKEVILENQKIYEDDHVIVLVDYRPIIPGHCLIIPKRHVERLEHLRADEIVAMHQATSQLYKAAQKTYGANAYLIFQKNGKEAGQDVPHVHIHFLPRSPNDYTDIGMYARLFFSRFKSPLSQEQIDLQRDALSAYFVEPINSKVIDTIDFSN